VSSRESWVNAGMQLRFADGTPARACALATVAQTGAPRRFKVAKESDSRLRLIAV